MKKILTYILPLLLVLSCDKKPEHKNHTEQKPNDELHLSDLQVQLGHVLTDTVREHELGDELTLTGTISVNQNKTQSVSSRVMGRIEKLYFKNTGEEIKAGEPMYEIYSEELNLAIKELLQASEKRKSLVNSGMDMEKIFQSAKNKLLLYGLTEMQIEEIERTGNSSNTMVFFSPVSGIISSVDVKEGAYVMEGESLFHLADLSSLWVEAQVFPDDIKVIRGNMSATITFSGNETKIVTGKIEFINPELSSSSRINIIRIEIPNEKKELKPGMQAQISVLLNKKKMLAVPTDAVLLDGKGATVWLRTGHNQFKSVMVHAGIEADGYTEIIYGIKQGDVIVSSGAYLLNSEFTIRHGSNPMEGMKH